MPDASQQPPSNIPPSLSSARKITDFIQIILALCGAMAAVISYLKEMSALVIISALIMALSLCWHLALKRWRRKHRKFEPITATPSPRAYLRGLLPFEQGESLLGRAIESKQILAKISTADFRFGYLCGEAGVGKTSILRAALIPGVRALGGVPIYILRLGSDYLSAVRQSFKLEFGNTIDFDSCATLHEIITVATAANPNSRLYIILDQFEEFLTIHRARNSREQFIKDVGECYTDSRLPACWLIGIRKEFVDDLQDFWPHVPQPLDVNSSYRLRNWESKEALSVLNAASSHDQVPFADALKDRLIRDLEQNGEVRPVELQLVASYLTEKRIYDLDRYRNAEGARGILASYVYEVIEPKSRGDGVALEQQIARYLLRSLCSDDADIKRPEGLTYEQLRERIKATLKDKSQVLPKSDQEYDLALQRVLTRCQSAYLVILESTQTYNLINDYIVRPILDATSDVETAEAQANRLLQRYLDDQRRHPGLFIPFRHMRFIAKNASPQNKSAGPAIHLINRTKRVHRIVLTSAALFIIFIFLIISPPHVSIERESTRLRHADWIVSRNHRAAISFTENGRSILWQCDQPWGDRTEIEKSFMDIIISPQASYLAGITQDGQIYVWRAADKLTGDAKPILQILPPAMGRMLREPYPYRWGGFSPDEGWIYALAADGSFYLWRVGEVLSQSPQPYLQFVIQPRVAQPHVTFSPHGKYVAMVTGDGYLFIRRTDDLTHNPTTPDNRIGLTGNGRDPIAFSHDDEWIAVTTVSDGRLTIAKLSDFPSLTFTPVAEGESLQGRPHSAFQVFFSPDDRWVVARTVFGEFFTASVNEAARLHEQPTFRTFERGMDSQPGVAFSPDGKWVGGLAPDRGVYVWPLDKSPGAEVKASIPTQEGSPGLEFNANGSLVAACSGNGDVYVWKLGEAPDLTKPIAHHDNWVHLAWGAEDFLFTFGGSDVYGGVVTGKLQLLVREDSQVNDLIVTSDRERLIVFGDKNLSILRRRLYLWGIPLYTFSWPIITRRMEV